jgi:hypothetical protein
MPNVQNPIIFDDNEKLALLSPVKEPNVAEVVDIAIKH